MKKRLIGNIISISLILVFSCAHSCVFAQSSLSKKIAQGNKLYADGEYTQALTKYNDAQIQAPASPEIFFNMADVFFRQGKYKEAVDSYQKSMEKGDIDIEAKAMYNIGNSLFQLGQLREALKYYKQALERDPNDIDTKYNIEYTERMIKQMLSKSQETMHRVKQQQQKQQKQEQQKQEKQDRQSGEEKQQDRGQKEQNQTQTTPTQEDKKQTGKQEDQDKTAKAGKKEQDERQAQGAQVEKDDARDKQDLSKEEAERFLSAFQRDQKENPLLDQQQSRKGRGYYVEKDW